MQEIDYMNDPLDFCLYPNDIIQRFNGREVIVCGTDYEYLAFSQVFARFLRVKHIVNLFDYDALEHGKLMKLLDEVALFRTTEPVFVLSHRFWFEIMTYLESRGLVRGKDIFLWEQD